MDERFPFGRNWASFLEVLDESRVVEAERSLIAMVGRERIRGARFIDVGSGSGLFSLAAMRLGASRVHSFDYDPDSVACTRELRRRYFPNVDSWTVEQGSVLDEKYVRGLGQWDVVYSWGVLHHTGEMWKALKVVTGLTGPAGVLFIALYNDQGRRSRFWAAVKRFHNTGPIQRTAVLSIFVPWWAARGLVIDVFIRRKNPLRRYREYHSSRGMSLIHDWKDWLGGYPFEVAKPGAVVDFLLPFGLTLRKLTTCDGKLGCNEFVFCRSSAVEGGPQSA